MSPNSKEPPRLTSALTSIEKFNGTNFTTWKTKIRLVFMQYNVWRLVKGSEEKPEGTETSAAVIAWSDKNDRALAIMGLSVENNYIHLVDLDKPAQDVWSNLNATFGEELNNSKLFLKQQFYKMSIKTATLKEHINSLGILIQQLTALKSPPDDDVKKAVLLHSLEDNGSYAESLGVLRIARDMKYEEMVAVLMDTERRQQLLIYDEKAMFSKGKPSKTYSSKPPPKSPLKCTYCKSLGHTANRCFKRLDDLDIKDKANLVEDDTDEVATEITEHNYATMAQCSLDDEFGPDSWAF